MPPKFDDKPHPVSDIPEGHLGGLSWDEAHTIAGARYVEAGEPHDKLAGWLDDHQVYPKRADVNTRILSLDWFQMISLMAEAGHWRDEKREEDNPYGADLA